MRRRHGNGRGESSMISQLFRIAITLKNRSILAGFLSLPFVLSSWCGAQTSAGSNWKPVEEAMGRPGQIQPGDVIKFGMPRKDLHVVLDSVNINPGLALGSWAAFKRDGGGAMVMGDLVLTEDEVEPVMMKLQEGGIHESAVHNHLLGELPHVMYMHIASHGLPVQVTNQNHDAVALTKTPGPDATPAAPPTAE